MAKCMQTVAKLVENSTKSDRKRVKNKKRRQETEDRESEQKSCLS
jgi:hypothetical protein